MTAAGGSGRALSNLQLRLISAAVLAVAAIGLTWLGGLPFRLLAAVIAAAIFYEWCAMSRTPANARHQNIAAILLGVTLLVLLAGYPAAIVLPLLGLSVAAVAFAGWAGGQGRSVAAGLAYAGLSAVALAFLRDGDAAGFWAVLFLFAIVWATDILAYFVGRAVGGAKLAPSISPGKTWSGAIGGAVGGTLAGLAVATAVGQGNMAWLGLIALLLSVVSQIGDLYESAVKRRNGVKDSGSLIPGHGGVMDRVDGLVATAFALYVIGWLSATADNPAQGLFAI